MTTFYNETEVHSSPEADMSNKDLTRRFYGEFYTPTVWANEAHNLLDKVLGINWREELVVWDPCCGTGNLTRDYQFKELYCSTLHQSDIDIMNQRHYNPEAVKFQYDFLNDDVYPPDLIPFSKTKLERKAPGLVSSMEENRGIVFLMNPPYTTPSDWVSERDLRGSISSAVRELMARSKRKFGSGQAQLYNQFLYRIMMLTKQYNLENVVVGVFLLPQFFTLPGYREFRSEFFSHFKMVEGFAFDSGHFSGVNRGWPIIFCTFKSGKDSRCDFYFQVKGEKDVDRKLLLYNTDTEDYVLNWLKQDLIEDSREELQVLSRPRTYKFGSKRKRTTLYKGEICRLLSNGNSLWSDGYTCIAPTSGTGGIAVTKSNLRRVACYFAVKRVADHNFYTHLKEVRIPDTTKAGYSEFESDSIIFLLFNDKNYQVSLRDPLVKNEMFWLKRSSVLQLAEESNFDEMCRDCLTSNEERFLYLYLKSLKVSSVGKQVLDAATQVLRSTISRRKNYYHNHKESQLFCWDASWHQIKPLLNKDDLKDFNNFYNQLTNRLREKIYYFGFLK